MPVHLIIEIAPDAKVSDSNFLIQEFYLANLLFF